MLIMIKDDHVHDQTTKNEDNQQYDCKASNPILIMIVQWSIGHVYDTGKKVHDHWKNENDQDHKKALYPIPFMID